MARSRFLLNDLPPHLREQVERQTQPRDRTADSAPDVEPPARRESMGAQEGPRFSTPVRIHVHSIRKQLADPDGISCKAVIDGLVKAGILADDSAKEVKEVTQSQELTEDGEEKTIIQIYEKET